MRLTLLYVGLFLASAAGLLTITYFLVEHQLPQVTTTTNGAVIISGSDQLGAGVAAACDPAADGSAPSSSLRPAAEHLPGRGRPGVRRAAQRHAGPAAHRVRDRARHRGGGLGGPGLADGRAGAQPAAHDHRHRAPHLGPQPAPADRDDRPRRRAQGARRHLRPAARAARRLVPGPAPVRRERLARAAHAAGPPADPARGGAARQRGDQRLAAHGLRTGAGRGRAAGTAHRRPAHAGPGRARPGPVRAVRPGRAGRRGGGRPPRRRGGRAGQPRDPDRAGRGGRGSRARRAPGGEPGRQRGQVQRGRRPGGDRDRHPRGPPVPDGGQHRPGHPARSARPAVPPVPADGSGPAGARRTGAGPGHRHRDRRGARRRPARGDPGRGRAGHRGGFPPAAPLGRGRDAAIRPRRADRANGQAPR